MIRFASVRAAAAVLASAAVLAPAIARAQMRLPDTPAGRRAAAFLQTVQNGDTAAIRAFVNEQMDDGFQQTPIEQHQRQFGRMHADLAGGQVTAVTESGPDELEFVVSGARPLRIALVVEPAPPYRIAGIGVRPAGAPAPAATPEPPPPATLTDAIRAEVVDSVGKLFVANYLLPDSARVIAAKLKERLAAGAYASLATPAEFAAALTADIRSVNDDKHLRVQVGTPQIGPRAAPAGGSASGYRYLEGVRMLPGQVGYLKVPALSADRAAFDEVGRALTELAQSRAMIIDLRGSRGGSGQMSNFLISHFTQPGLLTLTRWNVAEGDTIPRRTLADVPGPRRTDVPLFVLVDSVTISASEDVAFVLHNLGRATLIGETTRGGGRNNQFLPAGHGFTVSVSVSKVWDPCTGKEWERVGIVPDIRVPPEQALDAALQAARTPERYRPPSEIPQRACRVQG